MFWSAATALAALSKNLASLVRAWVLLGRGWGGGGVAHGGSFMDSFNQSTNQSTNKSTIPLQTNNNDTTRHTRMYVPTL